MPPSHLGSVTRHLAGLQGVSNHPAALRLELRPSWLSAISCCLGSLSPWGLTRPRVLLPSTHWPCSSL